MVVLQANRRSVSSPSPQAATPGGISHALSQEIQLAGLTDCRQIQDRPTLARPILRILVWALRWVPSLIEPSFVSAVRIAIHGFGRSLDIADRGRGSPSGACVDATVSGFVTGLLGSRGVGPGGIGHGADLHGDESLTLRGLRNDRLERIHERDTAAHLQIAGGARDFDAHQVRGSILSEWPGDRTDDALSTDVCE